MSQKFENSVNIIFVANNNPSSNPVTPMKKNVSEAGNGPVGMAHFLCTGVHMEKSRVLTILQENYEVLLTGIEHLTESGGTIYLVEGRERKYLLKAAGKVFLNTIRQSVDIMCFLADRSFPVPEVIRTKWGTRMLEGTEEDEEYLFVLFEYIDGKEPDLCRRGEKVGELVSWLHKLLLSYQGALIKRDFRFLMERYIGILQKKNNPKAEAYAALGAEIWDRVKDCPVGICHGDLHRGKLLETGDGKIYVLGFDTVCLAPRMFDVAVMCDMTDYFSLKPEDIESTRMVYRKFLKGYTCHMSLEGAGWESFGDWVAIRHFQLQATMAEIYGLDFMDGHYIEGQLDWLENWKK